MSIFYDFGIYNPFTKKYKRPDRLLEYAEPIGLFDNKTYCFSSPIGFNVYIALYSEIEQYCKENNGKITDKFQWYMENRKLNPSKSSMKITDIDMLKFLEEIENGDSVFFDINPIQPEIFETNVNILLKDGGTLSNRCTCFPVSTARHCLVYEKTKPKIHSLAFSVMRLEVDRKRPVPNVVPKDFERFTESEIEEICNCINKGFS